MNAMTELLRAPWLYNLAYTLLHSLWQGALIAIIVAVLLRFTPIRLSNARYTIAALGLLFVIAASAATFFILTAVSSTSPAALATISFSQAYHLTKEPDGVNSIIASLPGLVQSNIPFFLILWFAGTLAFCLRVVGGLIYIGRLRREAMAIEGNWNASVQELARQLDIQQWISLASSPSIAAPVVVGYLKPVILIPIGMLTSLSSEQLETIFLHELMHIKRKDFVINLIQSFVEAIFFFNPFVWILSNLIKREREHCCDDAVVKLHGNALAYAHALSTLEEVRLSKVGLSLSLAQNKNQLLNRITRLMEKSVKNYSGRERIIPAVLLVIGITCASWISTQTGRNELVYRGDTGKQVVQDTTKKSKKVKKEKKAAAQQSNKNTSSDQNESTTNENKNEDDVSVYPAPKHTDESDLAMPPMPNVEAMMPPIPDIDIPEMEWRSNDWAEFGREFGERFQEKFGDFYEKHGEDIQKMIEEIERDVNSKFDDDWKVKMQDFALKQQELSQQQAEQWAKQAELAREVEVGKQRVLDQSQRMAEQAERLSEDIKRRHEREFRQHEEFEKNHKRFEERMKAFEERTHRFEAEMKEELIKDGYLGKDEKLTNMHWQNGTIEINGKKIKPEHEQKYNDLHKKYFEDKAFNAVE
jgi:bla regulator protein blaR1